MSQQKRHQWTEDDETIGFYLYRFGDKDLPFTKQELATMLGMGWNSMSLKVANFRALDGNGTMDGYTTQTMRVYERYKNTPDDEFMLIGMEAIKRRIDNRLLLMKEKAA
jgi:hypothetical protein